MPSTAWSPQSLNSTGYTPQTLNSTNYSSDPNSLHGIIMDDTSAILDDTVYTLDDASGSSPVTAPATGWTTT